ncbi:MAG: HAD hydrolase family protein, partial [Marinilabiliales bacterium]|nr:HAD hydrolase family protein [Marinilabiliales bacterium]
MSELKMVVTDLDGTLLQDDQTISREDNETLQILGEMGICRVAATGRNLFKVKKALKPDDPFDYVICSSGAGIVEWNTQKMIYSIHLDHQLVQELIDYLISNHFNFKVSDTFPDNHNFFWWQDHECPELERYIQVHSKMGRSERIQADKKYGSSQFLLFFEKESNHFEEVKSILSNQFPTISIIRT